MIFFKIAWNDFKKNIFMNGFIVAQVAVCLVLSAIMVSTIGIRSQYYMPFQDLLTSNGTFFKFTSFLNYDTEKMDMSDYLDNDAIRKECPNAEQVYSCYSLFGFIDSLGEGKPFTMQAYDDTWLERYQPELTEGRWFSTSAASNQIEVVVSENDYGVHVGDIISLTAFQSPNIVFTGKVVGKFKDNEKIIGLYLYDYGNTGMDFNSLYYPFNHKIEGQMAVLASHTAIEQIVNETGETGAVVQPIWSNVLLTYPDDIGQEQIDADTNQLLQYGYANAIELDEMRVNSRAYIMQEANKFIPVIVILMVLAFVSVISSSALITRKNLHRYAVYYVLGLRWKHCSVINLVYALISVGLSLVFSLAALAILPSVTETVNIIWSPYIALVFAGLVLLQLMVSMVMPMIMVGRNTPKQILSR